MNIKQLFNLTSFYEKKVKNREFKANRAKQGVKTANQTHLTPLKNNQKAGFLAKSQTQRKLNGLRGARFAEYGRSMVEMLGVLAVIGVLSVTAILGYRYAMTKYIANETINEINLRARDISFDMEAMIENNYVGDIEMKMGPITRMGYPITARTSPQYIDYFEIFVKEVPTDVCKELLRMPWQAPYSIFVGVEEFEASINICEQAETVELAYEFYKDMSSKDEIDEDNRHEIMRCKQDNHCICGTCNTDTGLCESYCLDSQTCKKDYDDPRWMVCCDKDYIMGDFCCASITADGQCCNREGTCCPPEKPLQDKDGNCHSCDEINGVDVGEYTGNCATCPKRYLGGGHNGRNYCTLCGVEGTPVEDKPLFYDANGICKSCDVQSVVNQAGVYDNYLCEKVCPDRELVYEGSWARCSVKCDTTTPLRANTYTCLPCDTPDAVSTRYFKEECATLCPNREEKNGYCILKTCPSDKPLKDKNGECYSCSEITGVNVGNYPEYCDVCPERHLETVSGVNYCTLPCGLKNSAYENKPLVDKEGNCHACNELNADTISTYLSVCSNQFTTTGYTNRTCCSICGIPGTSTENKPLQGANGSCYACDEINGVDVGNHPEYCDVCAKYGRYLGGGWNGKNYCTLCGVEGTPVENKPLFRDDNGTCRSCDETSIINQAGIYDEYLCDRVCSNRELVYEGSLARCVVKCDAENPLRSGLNSCVPCDIPDTISTRFLSASCATLCPNREEKNGYCILKTCPNDKPLRDSSNACHSCDEGNPITLSDPTTCSSICPNRFLNNSVDKRCIACGSEGSEVEDKPIWDNSGNCYSCNEPSNVDGGSSTTQQQATAENCNKACSNRVAEGQYCVRKTCLTGTFLASDNNCYECNISTAYKSTEEECQKCLNTRIYENGYCKLNY